MSHWKYKGKILKEAPSDMVGFVYMITCETNGKKYIGRKYFGTKRRKPLTKKQKAEGRKRREVIYKDSDWATYTGSSKTLNADIEKYGKGKFKFEILIMAKTKGQVNYLEENIQHKFDVLLSDKYYNDSIGSRRFVMVKFDKLISENIKRIKK